MRYEEHFDSWAGLSYEHAMMTRWDTNDSTTLKKEMRDCTISGTLRLNDENISDRIGS